MSGIVQGWRRKGIIDYSEILIYVLLGLLGVSMFILLAKYILGFGE